MNQDRFQGKSLKEWTDLFSDPASSLSALGKEALFERTYSVPLHLALWLEFFLIAGEEPVKEKWALLPLEEQTDLGIELLKCYLFQPVYIRLVKEERSLVLKAPLIMVNQEKFFQVEHGTGTNRKIELLYPLDHRRFWPELFGIFQEDFFSSEKVLKALEPGISLTSSSRLIKIKQRAETLGSFFVKGKNKETSTYLLPKDQSKTKNALEDIPGQAHEEIRPPKEIEPNHLAPAVSDLPPSPLLPPKRKKKKKSSQEQMELF
ncbi:MAG: hypothetical protein ABSE95_03045 [Thermodesulfobacteriota bacterium]|jgi:hypothetical protein